MCEKNARRFSNRENIALHWPADLTQMCVKTCRWQTSCDQTRTTKHKGCKASGPKMLSGLTNKCQRLGEVRKHDRMREHRTDSPSTFIKFCDSHAHAHAGMQALSVDMDPACDLLPGIGRARIHGRPAVQVCTGTGVLVVMMVRRVLTCKQPVCVQAGLRCCCQGPHRVHCRGRLSLYHLAARDNVHAETHQAPQDFHHVPQCELVTSPHNQGLRGSAACTAWSLQLVVLAWSLPGMC